VIVNEFAQVIAVVLDSGLHALAIHAAGRKQVQDVLLYVQKLLFMVLNHDMRHVSLVKCLDGFAVLCVDVCLDEIHVREISEWEEIKLVFLFTLGGKVVAFGRDLLFGVILVLTSVRLVADAALTILSLRFTHQKRQQKA
jgi:hypothetical protein